jgi:hypothetical protein
MTQRLMSLAAAFVLLLALSIGAGRLAAQDSGWYDAGASLTDNKGQAFISARLAFNLIDAGLTYARVTSGPCNGSPQEYIVYEATLAPEGASGQVYVGVLEPIGRLASPISTPPGSYDVFLFGRGAGGGFTVVVNDQTPSVTFTACFRVPE